MLAIGVRLEPRHCEALEEVFRRVSVNILNLEGCGLEDDVSCLCMYEFCAYQRQTTWMDPVDALSCHYSSGWSRSLQRPLISMHL